MGENGRPIYYGLRIPTAMGDIFIDELVIYNDGYMIPHCEANGRFTNDRPVSLGICKLNDIYYHELTDGVYI